MLYRHFALQYTFRKVHKTIILPVVLYGCEIVSDIKGET
jgi:hypothetical protein